VRTQLLTATDDARKADSVQSILRYALDGNVILYGPFEICRMVTFIDSPGTIPGTTITATNMYWNARASVRIYNHKIMH
jgi:tetrahydromethanopterin S-methyltransferase subunit H